MKVLAYDIYQKPELQNESMKYVEMDELLRGSDFISLHIPSLPGEPMVNRETIGKMKDGVVIINTSRGTNIDEGALLEALDSGKVFGAGLDVFAEEPSANSALYSHQRVSCTPHIGASTSEAQKRIGEEIVSIITKYFK
jgi:D-3-phosphoglycerate dehydrogenase